MRERVVMVLYFVLMSGVAQVEARPQYTAPPQVSAANETWFRAGTPIEWNGALYYPAGSAEAFDPHRMMRAGSYSGIPLYIETNPASLDVVLVPIGGGRVQPYLNPTVAAAPPHGLRLTPEGYVAQGPIPPTFARTRPLTGEPQPISPEVPIVASSIGTAAPPAAATSGRVTTVTNRPGVRPHGIDSAWIQFEGRRYVSAGKSVALTSDFVRQGEYRGWPVYQRRGDRTTIYVPMAGPLVAPFRPR